MQIVTNNCPPLCEHCKQEMDRIKRPALIKLITLGLPFKRYKCYCCNSKSYVFYAGDTVKKQGYYHHNSLE
jgi:hypothetical protein